MPTTDLIAAMRTTGTCRYFRPDPVPDEVLRDAVEAARFGPQGGNRQPVRFVAVRDAEHRRVLADLYLARWQPYLDARAGGGDGELPPSLRGADHFARHLAEVPLIIVVCVDLAALHPTDAGLGRLSVVGGASVYPIVQNLCLALRGAGVATALTTLLCEDEPKIAELLGLPAGFATAAHVAVGYPERGFPSRLKRQPVDSLLFGESFGRPLGTPAG